MGVYTKEEQFELIRKSPFNLEIIYNQYEEICIKAVSRENRVFTFVKEELRQTVLLNLFLDNYFLLYSKQLSRYIEENRTQLIDSNYKIENNIFCIHTKIYVNKDYRDIDMLSLIYLKDFLLKQNSNNTYIFDDENFNSEKSLNVIKELAISNNKLVVIDNGNIKDIHRKLANSIITLGNLGM